MKLIRTIIRGLFTWSLLLVLLGVAIAGSPHVRQDMLGLGLLAIIGGALGHFVFHRPQPYAPVPQPPAPAPTPIAPPASSPIPGAQGARTALTYAAVDTSPQALAITYRGQLKAYVTRNEWHPTGAFATLPAGDPEYRLVAMMSVYGQSVLATPGAIYTEQDAIAYALAQLLPHELIERDLTDPSRTAEAFALPADVLTPENLRALRDVIATHDALHTAHTNPSAP